jgi:hypothetical protein
MHVEIAGGGPRIVLVHGSRRVRAGRLGRAAAVAEWFTLVVTTRSRYPPNPLLDAVRDAARRRFCDRSSSRAGTTPPSMRSAPFNRVLVDFVERRGSAWGQTPART